MLKTLITYILNNNISYSGGARGVSVMEDMLGDIEILINSADKGLPLFILGHSMGGCLSLTLGARNPNL